MKHVSHFMRAVALTLVISHLLSMVPGAAFAALSTFVLSERCSLCGEQIHEHTDECYSDELLCQLPEIDGYVHSEDCYELVCELEEHKEEDHCVCGELLHEHIEECYGSTLTCVDSSSSHIHMDSCYVLECTKAVHVYSADICESEESKEVYLHLVDSEGNRIKVSISITLNEGDEVTIKDVVEETIEVENSYGVYEYAYSYAYSESVEELYYLALKDGVLACSEDGTTWSELSGTQVYAVYEQIPQDVVVRADLPVYAEIGLNSCARGDYTGLNLLYTITCLQNDVELEMFTVTVDHSKGSDLYPVETYQLPSTVDVSQAASFVLTLEMDNLSSTVYTSARVYVVSGSFTLNNDGTAYDFVPESIVRKTSLDASYSYTVSLGSSRWYSNMFFSIEVYVANDFTFSYPVSLSFVPSLPDLTGESFSFLVETTGDACGELEGVIVTLPVSEFTQVDNVLSTTIECVVPNFYCNSDGDVTVKLSLVDSDSDFYGHDSTMFTVKGFCDVVNGRSSGTGYGFSGYTFRNSVIASYSPTVQFNLDIAAPLSVALDVDLAIVSDSVFSVNSFDFSVKEVLSDGSYGEKTTVSKALSDFTQDGLVYSTQLLLELPTYAGGVGSVTYEVSLVEDTASDLKHDSTVFQVVGTVSAEADSYVFKQSSVKSVFNGNTNTEAGVFFILTSEDSGAIPAYANIGFTSKATGVYMGRTVIYSIKYVPSGAEAVELDTVTITHDNSSIFYSDIYFLEPPDLTTTAVGDNSACTFIVEVATSNDKTGVTYANYLYYISGIFEENAAGTAYVFKPVSVYKSTNAGASQSAVSFTQANLFQQINFSNTFYAENSISLDAKIRVNIAYADEVEFTDDAIDFQLVYTDYKGVKSEPVIVSIPFSSFTKNGEEYTITLSQLFSSYIGPAGSNKVYIEVSLAEDSTSDLTRDTTIYLLEGSGTASSYGAAPYTFSESYRTTTTSSGSNRVSSASNVWLTFNVYPKSAQPPAYIDFGIRGYVMQAFASDEFVTYSFSLETDYGVTYPVGTVQYTHAYSSFNYSYYSRVPYTISMEEYYTFVIATDLSNVDTVVDVNSYRIYGHFELDGTTGIFNFVPLSITGVTSNGKFEEEIGESTWHSSIYFSFGYQSWLFNDSCIELYFSASTLIDSLPEEFLFDVLVTDSSDATVLETQASSATSGYWKSSNIYCVDSIPGTLKASSTETYTILVSMVKNESSAFSYDSTVYKYLWQTNSAGYINLSSCELWISEDGGEFVPASKKYPRFYVSDVEDTVSTILDIGFITVDDYSSADYVEEVSLSVVLYESEENALSLGETMQELTFKSDGYITTLDTPIIVPFPDGYTPPVDTDVAIEVSVVNKEDFSTLEFVHSKVVFIGQFCKDASDNYSFTVRTVLKYTPDGLATTVRIDDTIYIDVLGVGTSGLIDGSDAYLGLILRNHISNFPIDTASTDFTYTITCYDSGSKPIDVGDIVLSASEDGVVSDNYLVRLGNVGDFSGSFVVEITPKMPDGIVSLAHEQCRVRLVGRLKNFGGGVFFFAPTKATKIYADGTETNTTYSDTGSSEDPATYVHFYTVFPSDSGLFSTTEVLRSNSDTEQEVWSSWASYKDYDEVYFRTRTVVPDSYVEGDALSYTFTIIVPENYWHDEYSSGVFLELGEKSVLLNSYTVPADGQMIINVDDLQLIAETRGLTLSPGDEIVVRYPMFLDCYYVEPNAGLSWEGYAVSSKVECSLNGNIVTSGNTRATVFTNNIVITLKDAQGVSLTGGELELYSLDAGEWVQYEDLYEYDSSIYAWGMPEGRYKIVQTGAPQGYVPVNDTEFEIAYDVSTLNGMSTMSGVNVLVNGISVQNTTPYWWTSVVDADGLPCVKYTIYHKMPSLNYTRHVLEENDSTGEKSWGLYSSADMEDIVEFRSTVTINSSTLTDSNVVRIYDNLGTYFDLMEPVLVLFDGVVVNEYVTAYVNTSMNRLTVEANLYELAQLIDKELSAGMQLVVYYIGSLAEYSYSYSRSTAGTQGQLTLLERNSDGSEDIVLFTTNYEYTYTFSANLRITTRAGTSTVNRNGAAYVLEKWDGAAWSVLAATSPMYYYFTAWCLDEGHYRLRQTSAPAGRQLLSPVEFDIVFNVTQVGEEVFFDSISCSAENNSEGDTDWVYVFGWYGSSTSSTTTSEPFASITHTIYDDRDYDDILDVWAASGDNRYYILLKSAGDVVQFQSEVFLSDAWSNSTSCQVLVEGHLDSAFVLDTSSFVITVGDVEISAELYEIQHSGVEYSVTFHDIFAVAEEVGISDVGALTLFISFSAIFEPEIINHFGADTSYETNGHCSYTSVYLNISDVGFVEQSTDVASVLTNDIILEYVDSDGNPIVGGTFDIYRWNTISNDYVYYDSMEVVDTGDPTQYGSVFIQRGIDAYFLKIVQTSAPEGHVQMDPIIFSVSFGVRVSGGVLSVIKPTVYEDDLLVDFTSGVSNGVAPFVKLTTSASALSSLTVLQEVLEVNDSTGVEEWKTNADHDDTDVVSFRTILNIPVSVDEHDGASLIVNERLDVLFVDVAYIEGADAWFHQNVPGDGLHYNTGSVSITYDGKVVDPTFYTVHEYPLSVGSPYAFTVEFPDINAVVDALNIDLAEYPQLIINFTATLAAAANTASWCGKASMSVVELVSVDGEVIIEAMESNAASVFYQTFYAHVIDKDGYSVYGTTLMLQKWDGVQYIDYRAGDPLDDGYYNDTFYFYGLDSGKYRLVFTSVPEGYVQPEYIEFEFNSYISYKESFSALEEIYIIDHNVLSGDNGGALRFYSYPCDNYMYTYVRLLDDTGFDAATSFPISITKEVNAISFETVKGEFVSFEISSVTPFDSDVTNTVYDPSDYDSDYNYDSELAGATGDPDYITLNDDPFVIYVDGVPQTSNIVTLNVGSERVIQEVWIDTLMDATDPDTLEIRYFLIREIQDSDKWVYDDSYYLVAFLPKCVQPDTFLLYSGYEYADGSSYNHLVVFKYEGDIGDFESDNCLWMDYRCWDGSDSVGTDVVRPDEIELYGSTALYATFVNSSYVLPSTGNVASSITRVLSTPLVFLGSLYVTRPRSGELSVSIGKRKRFRVKRKL